MCVDECGRNTVRVGLGDYASANEELEQITPRMRVHPDVLEVRWQIHEHAKEWGACMHIADALVRSVPEVPNAWIRRSFALHSLKRTQEAFDLLLPAAVKFPGVWTIPYNLACYSAQLGQLEECQEWLKKAMAVDDKTVPRIALDDPDLQPLWDSMSGTLWKRC